MRLYQGSCSLCEGAGASIEFLVLDLRGLLKSLTGFCTWAFWVLSLGFLALGFIGFRV